MLVRQSRRQYLKSTYNQHASTPMRGLHIIVSYTARRNVTTNYFLNGNTEIKKHQIANEYCPNLTTMSRQNLNMINVQYALEDSM